MEVLSPASSSTSPSCSLATPSSPSPFLPGGRAIDRHNPIITDEKRRGAGSAPATPCSRMHPIKPPTPPPPTTHQQQGSKRSKKLLGRKTKNAQKESTTDDHQNHDDLDRDGGAYGRRRSTSEPSELMIMKAAATSSIVGTVNMERKEYLISPPESSRYLLSEFDPVLESAPDNSYKDAEVEVAHHPEPDPPAKNPNPPLPGSSSEPSDQVVVLRVSLHCRGCERKMKKHLSRMAGVTSFNVDFAAKKVTVVGDVTPLQVLASISKVKNAQLMTAPVSISSKTMEAWK